MPSVTEPTTPLGIAELLRPHTKQVTAPGVLLLQEKDLLVSEVPLATLADANTDVE